VLGQALLKAQNGKSDEALSLAQEARRLNPQAPQAILLEAKILASMKRDKEASQLLNNALRAQPDSYSLRLNYARSLLRINNLGAAEREFQALVERSPHDDSLHLSLALTAFDNQHDDIAKRELLILQDSNTYADEARYYLGLLALRQNDKQAAMDAFESVEPGDRYVPALAEITQMLMVDGHIDEARARLDQARSQTPELQIPIYQLEADLLSENGQDQAAWNLLTHALRDQPENPQLLLIRAMIAIHMNRLADFEADIREVLRYAPNDPDALNALGYTLADRTGRIDEAEAYVRRAYALKPDDPAIIDSMGWVKFKRGDIDGALVDLRRAYALFPDDEIASHLGEALWVKGKHDEARHVWADALRQHPKSEFIPKTRQRLDPSQ
jgi:Flp pilus assembly protein TadD